MLSVHNKSERTLNTKQSKKNMKKYSPAKYAFMYKILEKILRKISLKLCVFLWMECKFKFKNNFGFFVNYLISLTTFDICYSFLNETTDI